MANWDGFCFAFLGTWSTVAVAPGPVHFGNRSHPLARYILRVAVARTHHVVFSTSLIRSRSHSAPRSMTSRISVTRRSAHLSASASAMPAEECAPLRKSLTASSQTPVR